MCYEYVEALKRMYMSTIDGEMHTIEKGAILKCSFVNGEARIYTVDWDESHWGLSREQVQTEAYNMWKFVKKGERYVL